ncbi:unnamed protein product [Phytophthora lilii]|uniref:Unnamed protein product n=1 Tax=Phytophthora lilii TaxID=2077276 RepID=A0A9W6WTM8_9STRA|nr:unnamed protein product [Phytophthora lilii]
MSSMTGDNSLPKTQNQCHAESVPLQRLCVLQQHNFFYLRRSRIILPQAISTNLQCCVVLCRRNNSGDSIRPGNHLGASLPVDGLYKFGKFVLPWFAVSLSIFVNVFTGQLLAFALPNVTIASLTGFKVSTVSSASTPPGSSISAGYQWLYTITQHRYAMSILATLVYSDCPTTLNAATGSYMNVGPEIVCLPLDDAPVSIGNRDWCKVCWKTSTT